MNNLAKKYQGLSPLGKVVVVITIISVLASMVMLIISVVSPEHQPVPSQPGETREVTIDPISGLEVDTISTGGIPEPGPIFLGDVVLLDYGMMFDTTTNVLAILKAYYTEHKLDDQEVTRISFAPELTHIKDDSADINTYIVKIGLNVNTRKTLTIVVTEGSISSISVADPDGQNMESIYSAAEVRS